MQPWLGEKAGVFFERYDGNDFTGYGVVVQTTDADAAQSFIDKQAKSNDEPVKDASYEGVDYKVQSSDGTLDRGDRGIPRRSLKTSGRSRTWSTRPRANRWPTPTRTRTPIDAAPSGSLADVYVDVGALIEQAGGNVDPQALQALKSAGIDPTEATALASVVPGSDQIEIDVSSDLGGEKRSQRRRFEAARLVARQLVRRLRRLRLRRPAEGSDRQARRRRASPAPSRRTS